MRQGIVGQFLVVGVCIVGLGYLAMLVTGAKVEARPAPGPQAQESDQIHQPIPSPDDAVPNRLHRIQIGPIDGLTTAWHLAPEETAAPLDIILQLKQIAPLSATINWNGANEVERDGVGSYAECPLDSVGTHVVSAEVILQSGVRWESSTRLEVVPVAVRDISVSPISIWVDTIQLDEESSNEETRRYYKRDESIASLHDLGDGNYVTSIRRLVNVSVIVQPLGFEPLVEWRYDGYAKTIGAQQTLSTGRRHPRSRTVSAGPLANEQRIDVQTYRVVITNGIEEEIPEGEPVLFTAVTEPPGFEDQITWLSSTKYGTATPVLGEGPEFMPVFDNVSGPEGIWLGVRADITRLGNDVPPPPEKNCKYTIRYVLSHGNCTDCPLMEFDVFCTNPCEGLIQCLPSDILTHFCFLDFCDAIAYLDGCLECPGNSLDGYAFLGSYTFEAEEGSISGDLYRPLQ